MGDIVAVYQTASGESTIKQLSSWDRRRGRMLLTPHNLDLNPFTIDLGPDDQVRRVQAVVRRYPVRA